MSLIKLFSWDSTRPSGALMISVVVVLVFVGSILPVTRADGDTTDVPIESGSQVETTTTTLSQHKDVHYAVNAGGPRYVGSKGVIFANDLDAGMKASGGSTALVPVHITRALPIDIPIYQTERYGLETFSYEFETPPDGKYTIVLKFAEVAFSEAGKKVFNVVLNGKHVIVRDLDIFRKVGAAAAYDEYATFSIKGNSLKYKRKQSKVSHTIKIEFVKGVHDNPKVCAIVIINGTAKDAVAIAPLFFAGDDDETTSTDIIDNERESGSGSSKQKPKKQKQPKPAPLDEFPLPILTIIIAIILSVVITMCIGGDK
eukprot:m.199768 g.199768  ORF g.199768 m.199768 type:complete len:314 (+) comp32747_c1_seq4:875-1816(+)